MIIIILRYDWLLALTKLIGAVLPTTTLFLGSILFLVLLSVQFSMKISKLSDQVKDLVQENALLRYEFERSAGTQTVVPCPQTQHSADIK